MEYSKMPNGCPAPRLQDRSPKEPTICVRCKHCIKVDDMTLAKCEAHSRYEYLTGVILNYGYCIHWNTEGTCPDYEEAKDD